MRKINQKGFTIIEGLLILVVAGLIIGAGWYVAKTRSDTDKSLNNTANSQNQNATTKKPADSTKYLVIKEWGVKLPLSKDIEDAYYIALKENTDDFANVSLGSRSLTTLSPACGPESGQISIAEIFRQSVTDHDNNVSQNAKDNSQMDVGTIKVGNYYFGFLLAQAACSESSEKESMKKQIAVREQFKTAFEHIKEVN